MKRLYLVRHAIAFERGERWPNDAKRPLTPKGAAKMRAEVAGLRRLGVELDLVLTSPLDRAIQTAELIVAGWRERPALVVTDSLAPGRPRAAVAKDLARHAARDNIALVGHEPGLGELVARLIGAPHALALKKGAVACVEVEVLPVAGPGRLVWLATPKMLRGLGRGERCRDSDRCSG